MYLYIICHLYTSMYLSIYVYHLAIYLASYLGPSRGSRAPGRLPPEEVRGRLHRDLRGRGRRRGLVLLLLLLLLLLVVVVVVVVVALMLLSLLLSLLLLSLRRPQPTSSATPPRPRGAPESRASGCLCCDTRDYQKVKSPSHISPSRKQLNTDIWTVVLHFVLENHAGPWMQHAGLEYERTAFAHDVIGYAGFGRDASMASS